jgi:chromosome partitioning protein
VARVIAIANQKGGVGKTTTAVNLAASLAVAEQRTLLIDGDPQGNATSGIGLAGEQITGTVYDALIGQQPLDEIILRAIQFAHLDVAPTTPDLAGAEIELIDRDNRELAMRDALAPIRDRYDYILIDCPPSLGLLTINMLTAADAVLIPVQCEYYALEGLSQLLNTVHRIQQSVNPDLAIDGVLLTMYDARLNLSRQVVTDAREYFGPKVFETIIPRNVRLAEAPSFGKPIVLYDIASVGAQAYLSVARELVQRDTSSPASPEPVTERSQAPELVSQPEGSTEAPADTAPESGDERSSDADSGSAYNAVSEAASGATYEVTADVTSDVASDIPSEAASDMASDMASDTALNAAPEPAFDSNGPGLEPSREPGLEPISESASHPAPEHPAPAANAESPRAQ